MTTAEAPPRVTIARIPAGQPLELFSALCGFFGAALTDCLMSAGDGYGNAAEVVAPDGVTARHIVRALEHATRKLNDAQPEPAVDVSAEDDQPADDLTLNAMRRTEGGVEFGVGAVDEHARAFAKGVIEAFVPVFEATNAVNYLSWDAVAESGGRYSLIVVKSDGLTPHEARQQADAEAARLNQLRSALVEAAKLPADVSDDVLLAEVASRFAGVVRAVVGHGAVRGVPECECGEATPTRGDWVEHVEALRAQGVPTATIAVHPPDGAR